MNQSQCQFTFTERQREGSHSNLVAGLRRSAFSGHRRWHRVPTAPKRRLVALSRLNIAPFQHH